MDEKNPTPNQGGTSNPQPPAQPTPAPAQPTQAPVQPAPPAQTVIIQKSSPWPWIVGGCLMITILIIAAVFFVGWWGARQVKNEIKKYEPTVEKLKDNADKLNQQAEGWENKSRELQESMPDPEEFAREFEDIE